MIILDNTLRIEVIPAGAMVAHLTSNQGVPGSIPGSGIIHTLLFLLLIFTIMMCLHEFIKLFISIDYSLLANQELFCISKFLRPMGSPQWELGRINWQFINMIHSITSSSRSAGT